MPRLVPIALLITLGLAACGDDDATPICYRDGGLDWGQGGELMLPGTDCNECHRSQGSASEFVFTVAGTVFDGRNCPQPIPAATIHVLDAEGVSISLTSNQAGNFFTDQELTPPYAFAVELDGVTVEMGYPVDNGSCGRCHAQGSSLGYVYAGR